MRTTWGRVAVALLALAAAAGCDWVQYRGDAARTGTVHETVLGLDNVAGLEHRWTVTVGDPAAPQPVRDPVVAGGTVVAGSGLALGGYDAASGASRWSYDFPDPFPPLSPTVTAPGVAEGAVLVGYAGPLTSGGATGAVVRFDPATGAELPALDDHSSINLAVTSPVAVTSAGDVWFAGGAVCPQAACKYTGIEGVLASGRTVVALRATPPAEPPGSPVAVGDGVAAVVGGDGVLRAYDAAGVEGCTSTGEADVVQCAELWSAPVGRAVGTPVIRDGYVVVVTGSQILTVSIVGPPGTRTPQVGADVVGGTAPSMPERNVYVGTADGLRVYTGCMPLCPWLGVTGAPVATPPTVANNVAYVTTTDGHLHAFAAWGCSADIDARCEPLWSVPTPGIPTSSPVVANGRVYVGTSTGQLAAYGLS